MHLLKLTIASGPEKGGSLYVHTDKICCFIGVGGHGEGKRANIRLDTGYEYMVEETAKNICDMLESSKGYLQITSMPTKN